jgi:carbohydrate kinase (thermoresistant glucokinase family)
MHIVLMGVSGCGKTTVGERLAEALGLPFIEGDELHPPANVARMAAGVALTDDDRAGWLEAVGAALAAAPGGAVASCSALKRAYRDRLRAAVPGLRLVHLHGAPALLAERLATRRGHYMPPSLLQSQLDTLEMPALDEGAVVADVTRPPEDIVASVRRQLLPVHATSAHR